MKRTLFTLAMLVALIAGCPGAVDPAASPTTLADARQTCENVGDPEPGGFNIVVDVFRAFRDDGLLESDALSAVAEGCVTDPNPNWSVQECFICFTAIIAAVYNE